MNNQKWDTEFEVQGAGSIRFGNTGNSWTGTAVGFSIGASWGAHGWAGGVMDREEAKRLADHIYAVLESDELKSRDEVMRIYT